MPQKRARLYTNEEAAEISAARKPAKRKGGAGQLSRILHMPLEILFEILGHLTPLDVLLLARLTKGFRRVLMSKSSISIWKSARANDSGLPECPPDLIEPQWASLLFSQHCHMCLAPGIRTIDWQLRIRLCPRCVKHQIYHWDSRKDPIFPDFLSHVGLVPTRPSRRYHLAHYIPELDRVEAEYLSIKHEPLAREDFLRRRHALVKDIAKRSEVCQKWSETNARSRQAKLQHVKSAREQAIVGRLTVMGWHEEITAIQFPDSLKYHKSVKIPQALTDRIWMTVRPELLKFMEDMRRKRLAREFDLCVNARKPFAIQVLRSYKTSQLPDTIVMPGPLDFCQFPVIKGILEQPVNVQVDVSSFAGVVSLLPGSIHQWRARVVRQLIRKSKHTDEDTRHTSEQIFLSRRWGFDEASDSESGSDAEDEDEDRVLATTVFTCTNCTPISISQGDIYYAYMLDDPEIGPHRLNTSKPLFFPKVLGHSCLTRKNVSSDTTLRKSDDVSKSLEYLGTVRKKWSCRGLLLDRSTGNIVKRIVEACQLDPTTTTACEMDTLDPRLACLSCADINDADSLDVDTFGWRSAVKHHAERHYHKVVTWKLLSAEETERAISSEQRNYEMIASCNRRKESYLSPSDLIVWSCVHCRDLPSERDVELLEVTIEHSREAHGILQPELNVDYYKDFAAPQIYKNDAYFKHGGQVLRRKPA